eukprot:gb/GECG01004901.1/.p1 GENE.gb/GECG01004901.1/~~gb/GECG01004901.1/.p1  ORF type:complete len:113 (+),score=9.85 gb/GECG01004901.1/:1-339(+)
MYALLSRWELQVAPNHANTLYNYGVLMDSLKKHDDAEQLFTQATQANSSHAYALYNLAVLKEDIRKDLDGAEKVLAGYCPVQLQFSRSTNTFIDCSSTLKLVRQPPGTFQLP